MTRVRSPEEARWARSRSGSQVLDRLTRARQKLIAIIATITDDEASGPIGPQWSGEAICRHVDQHLAKIKFD